MENEEENSIKTILNESAKLIDILNILTNKIEGYDAKLPIKLMEEVYELCFSLGSNLCMAEKTIGIDEENCSKEDNIYNNK